MCTVSVSVGGYGMCSHEYGIYYAFMLIFVGLPFCSKIIILEDKIFVAMPYKGYECKFRGRKLPIFKLLRQYTHTT